MTEIFADRDDLEPPSSDVSLESIVEGADWTPIPEYQVATAEQLWALLLKLPAEERLQRIRNIVNAVEGNNRCFTAHANHDELQTHEFWRLNALEQIERKLIVMSLVDHGPKGSVQSIVHNTTRELLIDLRKRITGDAQ